MVNKLFQQACVNISTVNIALLGALKSDQIPHQVIAPKTSYFFSQKLLRIKRGVAHLVLKIFTTFWDLFLWNLVKIFVGKFVPKPALSLWSSDILAYINRYGLLGAKYFHNFWESFPQYSNNPFITTNVVYEDEISRAYHTQVEEIVENRIINIGSGS